LSTAIHKLALAGMLMGLDKFILPEPGVEGNTGFLKNREPFFLKISSELNEDEIERIEKVSEIIKENVNFKREPFYKSPGDFHLLEELEDRWNFLSPHEFDSFFMELCLAFSGFPLFPHCQLLSALSACGDYPFLFGGRIAGSSEYIFSSKSIFQGEIVTGRLIFMHIFSRVLPLFQARSYPLPASCILETDEREFFAILPGPIASRGEKSMSEINKWLLEKRQGEVALCWHGMEFPFEQANELHFLSIRLKELLRQKELNIFSQAFLNEGKHIFYMDFSEGLCPSCKKRPSCDYSKISLCSNCEKEMKIAKKASSSLFINLEPLRNEDITFPEIIKTSKEDILITADFAGPAPLPLYYPALPSEKEEMEKICHLCESGRDKKICSLRESFSLPCMASLSGGRKKLLFVETGFLPPGFSSYPVLDNLYVRNFFLDIFAFLDTGGGLEKFCLNCEYKQICSGKLLCLFYFQASSNKICFGGAWDRVLNILALIFSERSLPFPIYGRGRIFSPEENIFLSLKEDRFLKACDICPETGKMEIFGTVVRYNQLRELIEFSLFLKDALLKDEIEKTIIITLNKCRYLIESYFNNNNASGLRFLPLISMEIKGYRGEIREKLLKLLDMDRESTILPSISFIINYLNLAVGEQGRSAICDL